MELLLVLIIFGILLILILVWLMRRRTIQVFYTDKPFDQTADDLARNVDEAGWKLLTTHDIQEKLTGAGYDFKRISVYEICRPDYAAAVLKRDSNKKFSSLMPCRISLYELKNGQTGLAMINAGLLSSLFGGVIARVMGKAARESELIIHNTMHNTQS